MPRKFSCTVFRPEKHLKFLKRSNRLQIFHAREIKCIKKVQMIYKITKIPPDFETQVTQRCVGGEKI